MSEEVKLVIVIFNLVVLSLSFVINVFTFIKLYRMRDE